MALGSTLAGAGAALAIGLVADDAQLWQAADLAGGTGPTGVQLGLAVATGDFDGDGEVDLAIGDPEAEVGGQARAGAVYVAYGSPNGLGAPGSEVWTQDSTGLQNLAELDDEFGFALASGNFNGDAYDDLAIGIPGETINGNASAGAVAILFGSASGLSDAGNDFLHYDRGLVSGVTAPGDRYGHALAAGRFNDDAYADLAIGVPQRTASGVSNGGNVQVFFGTDSGMSRDAPLDEQAWEQGFNGLMDAPEIGDQFGFALVAGDFDDDGRDDLAIGVPFESVGGDSAAGAVHQVFGSAAGLTPTGNNLWHQDASLDSEAEPNEQFGYSLAAGNFDGNAYDDLAVGVPGTVESGFSNAGAVQVIFGSSIGLWNVDDQHWGEGLIAGAPGPEQDARFGESLAAGDFDGDAYDDLAIGSPGDTVTSQASAGSVHVLYGSSGGPQAAGSQYWTQDDSSIDDTPEAGDGFASALASGDFDADGADDLASGVPFEDGVGGVNALYGDACGNGILQGPEACDDGNETSGDGCSDQCVIEFCGDGIIQPGLGEECDDGGNVGGDGCAAACWNENAAQDLFGHSMKGSVSITVGGVALGVSTNAGATADEVLAAVAQAIEAEGTYRAAFVGGLLYTNGSIDTFSLADLGLSVTPLTAITTGYADRPSFDAALGGAGTTVEDFESLADQDPVSTLGDLGVMTMAPVEGPIATAAFESESPAISLGVDNGDEALLDGDALAFSLAAPNTFFGLYLVTSDPAEAGEIRVVTPVGTASNSDVPDAMLSDGGLVYFVGLVSDTPFSDVTLGFDQDGESHFVYTVDDTIYLPEPGFALSLASGLACLGLLSRLRSRAGRSRR